MKFFKLINNKHGISSLEMAIGAMIFAVIIAGIVDLSNTVIKFNTTSSVVNYVARTIGEQGGIKSDKHENYYDNYISSGTIAQHVTNQLNSTGISTWTLDIEALGSTYRMTPGVSVEMPILPYGTSVTLTLNFQYEWTFVNRFIPAVAATTTKTSTRTVVTTFHPRNQNVNTIYGNN